MRRSIAMCTYNGGRFLRDQLDSIAAQTLPPDELVICDDGSTDDTVAIAEDFRVRSDFKVHLSVNETRLGVTRNFSQAIAACTGDLIFLSDQDDVWLPNKLQQLTICFEERPELGLAFGDLALMSHDGQPLNRTQWERLGFTGRLRRAAESGALFEVLLRFNVVNGAASAFRASLRPFILPIPDDWVHDEWVALIASAAAPTAVVAEVVARYRQHAAQQVGPAVAGVREQLRYARERMGASYFEKQVRRTAAARDRAEGIVGGRRDAVPLLDRRLEHYQRRLAMRSHTRISRWPGVIGEAVRGNYRRFGYGWKGAAQDSLLP